MFFHNKKISVVLLSLIIFIFVGIIQAQQVVPSKLPIKVLYIEGSTAEGDVTGGGAEGRSRRSADFRQFLEKNFTQLIVIKDSEFTMAAAKDADVIILDGDISDQVSPGFDQATILFGLNRNSFGLTRNLGRKLIDSCISVSEKLHDIRTSHLIFRSPLSVRLEFKDDFDKWTQRHVQAWVTGVRLQSRYGDVEGISADRRPLLGAEDSEILAEELSLKYCDSVALAREANIFYWGMPHSPGEMTEPTRKVFINTIVYMKQFNGVQPTARRSVPTRDSLLSTVAYIQKLIAAKSDERFLQTAAEGVFPRSVVRQNTNNLENYLSSYTANLDYLYVPSDSRLFEVDEEAKQIGVPNNDVYFLQRCIELLNQANEAATARRLLERYTGLTFSNAAAWQQWLESNRENLYFSDYFGYRWFTGPAMPAPPEGDIKTGIERIEMIQPTENFPVTVGAAAIGYSLRDTLHTIKWIEADGKNRGFGVLAIKNYRISKGALFTIAVRLKHAPGWSTIAKESADGKQIPVTINVELPEGARWDGDWKMPTPTNNRFSDDVVFTRNAYFMKAPAPKSDEPEVMMPIKGIINYQPCKGENCFQKELEDGIYSPIETSIAVLTEATGKSTDSHNETAKADQSNPKLPPSVANSSLPTALRSMKIENPDQTNPVSLGAIAVSEKSQGSQTTLALRMKIANGWHIYAQGGAPESETKFDVQLPTGASWSGDWQFPPSQPGVDPGVLEYKGDVVFTRNITFSGAVPERITGTVRYQACTTSSCLPPKREPFAAEIVVQNNSNAEANNGVEKSSTTGAKVTNVSQTNSKSTSSLKVGDNVPDFSFTDFTGKTRKFSEFKGKVVLLDFWATWCSPCLKDIPKLKVLYDKYKAQGFEIIGMDAETIGEDEEPDPELTKEADQRARQIVVRLGANWTQVTNETAVPIGKTLFGVKILPTKILIDREGKIIAVIGEKDDTAAIVEKYLGKR